MEYVDGENIRKYASGDLRLPLPKIYKLATEVLSAMVYMQGLSKPIFHRDIKPENIMLDKSDRFVLIDFNIATDSENVGKDKMGTYPYLAPDLIAGSNVNWDASADTFALGVTLYEMLTHIYPWSGGKRIPVLDKAPIDILSQNSLISSRFAEFVMKAIGTRKADRFTSAKDMYDALVAIGEDNIATKEDVVEYVDTDFSIVEYLNSLYSQSKRGNAGTRAGLKIIFSIVRHMSKLSLILSSLTLLLQVSTNCLSSLVMPVMVKLLLFVELSRQQRMWNTSVRLEMVLSSN